MTSLRLSLLAVFVLSCAGDTGPQGPVGPAGDPGAMGTGGDPGGDGADGSDGNDGRNPLLVGPGLNLEILDVSLDGTGTTKVTYRITDGNGRPLDLDGVFTEGAVEPRFVLASLDQNAAGEPLQYTAFTLNVDGQPTAERNGTSVEMGVGDGIYEYTLEALVANDNPSLTHTMGMQARREYEGVRYVANATYDFRPDAEAVIVTRDIVTTSACNGCHNPLSRHGRQRREVKYCILCHQPSGFDDEGTSVDFKVMIHKIHRGEDLPSVLAGGSYEVDGHDFSTVEFPQDIRSCDTCHNGSQGDFWQTRPSRETCTSCHDLVSFDEVVPAGMEAHPAGPMPDDSSCANIGCHRATGGLAGIVDKHLFLGIDPAKPNLVITIDEIRNTGPGEILDVDFTATMDGVGRDILTTPFDRLRFTVAGPTIDYKEFFQVRAQHGGANADGILTAIDASAGKFTYTFPAANPIPVDATGSYALAMEARQLIGTERLSPLNPVQYFAVTDAVPVPRREVVDTAGGCNSCHRELAKHGGMRRSAEYCVMCHNPNFTDVSHAPAVEGSTGVVTHTLDFKHIIHGIHRGEDHANPFLLGGSRPSVANPAGTPDDYAELRFPGDLRSCGTCHVAGTFSLPLASTVLPSRRDVFTCTEDPATDTDELCEERTSVDDFTPPTASVCTACHDSDSSVAHAEIMTTSSGQESCATCHGPGTAFDIAEYHQLDP